MRNMGASLSFAMFNCWYVKKEVPCELKSQLSEIPAAVSKHVACFLNSLLENQSSWTVFNN
jgi:hypothetical protein